jgi:hypothetical protein
MELPTVYHFSTDKQVFEALVGLTALGPPMEIAVGAGLYILRREDRSADFYLSEMFNNLSSINRERASAVLEKEGIRTNLSVADMRTHPDLGFMSLGLASMVLADLTDAWGYQDKAPTEDQGEKR